MHNNPNIDSLYDAIRRDLRELIKKIEAASEINDAHSFDSIFSSPYRENINSLKRDAGLIEQKLVELIQSHNSGRNINLSEKIRQMQICADELINKAKFFQQNYQKRKKNILPSEIKKNYEKDHEYEVKIRKLEKELQTLKIQNLQYEKEIGNLKLQNENEIFELRKQIKSCKKESDQLSQNLKEHSKLEQKITHLEQKSREQEDQILEYQMTIQTHENKIRQQENQIHKSNQLNNENNELRYKLGEVLKENEELKRRNDEFNKIKDDYLLLQRENKQFKEERILISRKFKQLYNENKKLKKNNSQNAILPADDVSKDQLINELKKQNEEKLTKINQLQETVSKNKQKYVEFRNAIRILMTKQEELETTNKKINADLQEKVDENKNLNSENDKLQGQIIRLEIESRSNQTSSSTKNQIERIQNLYQEQVKENQKLQNQINDLTDQYENSIDSLKLKNETLNKAFLDAKSQYDKIKQLYEAKQNEVIDQFKSQSSNQNKDIIIENLNQQILNLKKDLQNNNIKKDIFNDDLLQKNKNQQNEINVINQEIEKLRNEAKAREKELSEIKEENEKYKLMNSQIQKKDILINQLNSEISEQNILIKKQQQKIDDLNAQTKKDISKRDNDYSILYLKIDKLQDDLETKQNELDEIKEENNKYKIENAQMQIELSNIQKNENSKRDSLILSLKQEIEKLQNILEAKEKELKRIKEENAKYKNAFSQIQKELVNNQKKNDLIKQLKNEIDKRGTLIQRQQDQINNLTEQAKKDSSKRDSLNSSLNQEIEKLRDDLEAKEEELNKVKEENTKHRTTNLQIQKELVNCQKKNDLIDQLQDKIIEKDNLIQRQQDQINNLTEQAKKDSSKRDNFYLSLNQDIEKLQNDLEAKEEELNRVKEENAKHRTTISQMRKELVNSPKKNDLITQLKNEIEKRDTFIQRQQDQINNLTEQTKKDNSKRDSHYLSLKQENEELQNDLDKKDEELNKVKKENKDKDTIIKKLIQENAEYKESISKIGDEFMEINKNYLEIKEQTEETAKEEGLKDSIIEKLKDKIISLDQENENLQNQIKKKPPTSSATISDDDKQHYLLLIQQKEDELETLRIENEKLKTQSTEKPESKASLSRIERQNKILQKHLDERDAEISKLKSLINSGFDVQFVKQLKEENAKLKAEVESAAAKIEKIETVPTINPSDFKDLEMDRDQYKQLYEAAQSELNAIKEDQKKTKIRIPDDELNKIGDEIKVKDAIIERLTRENDEYKKSISNIENEFKEINKNYLEIKEQTEEVGKEESFKDSIIERLKDKIITLKEESEYQTNMIRDLQTQLKTKSTMTTTPSSSSSKDLEKVYQSLLDKKEEELNKVKKEIKAKDAIIVSLTRENAEYKESISKIGDEFMEINKNYLEIKEQTEETAKEEGLKDSIIEKLKDKIISLDQENENLQNQIKKKPPTSSATISDDAERQYLLLIQQKEDELETLRIENEKLKSQSTEKPESKVPLHRIERQNQILQRNLDERDAEINKLKSLINSGFDVQFVKQLKEENAMLRDKVESAAAKIDRITEECRELASEDQSMRIATLEVLVERLKERIRELTSES